MAKERIIWIDALKGFGIFCVTLGHLGCFPALEKHIYSFHIFLFFFISGYLFRNNGSLKGFIAKRVKSLLIPFTAWNIISSIAGIGLGYSIKESIFRFFIVDGKMCWNAPIWFLLVLFIAEVLYAAMNRFGIGICGKIIITAISCVCWGLVGEINLPLKLNLVPLALFFYSIGDVVKGISQKQNVKLGTVPNVVIIILLGMLSVLFGAFLNIRITYTGGAFGNFFYCVIAGLSGTFFYYLLFKNAKVLNHSGIANILAYLGKNSLIIMVSQYWFFTLYNLLAKIVFGRDIDIWHWQNTVKALFVAIFTMAIVCTGTQVFKYLSARNKIIREIGSLLGIR